MLWFFKETMKQFLTYSESTNLLLCYKIIYMFIQWYYCFTQNACKQKGLRDREWHGQVSHGTRQDANSTVVPVRFSIWHRSVYTTRWSKWQSWLSTNVWNFIWTQGTGFTAQIMFLKPISALLSECQHDCLLTVLSKNSFINDFILSDKCGLDDNIKMNITLCWWEYC